MDKTSFVSGFLKVADDEAAIKLRLAIMGGVLSGVLGNAYTSMRLRKALLHTPKIPAEKIKDIYTSVGIDPAMPTKSLPGLANAMYAYPFSVGEPNPLDPKEWSTFLAKNKKLIKKLGLIAYDPRFSRAGILAHEAGHAAVETVKPRFSPSRLNQRYLTPISGFLNRTVSPLLSTGIGAVSGNPLIGAGIGGLTGLLTGTPELVNEYQASNYAKRYLDSDDHRMRDTTVDKNKDALRKAYHTYLLGNILPSAVSGGLGGLLFMR